MSKGKKAAMIGSLLALSLLVGCNSQTATHEDHGSTSAPSQTQKVTKASAEDIFKQNCATCHGQNLEGYVGPNLQKIGSKLNEKQILEVIKNGRGQMPGGLVSEDQAKTLAAWLAAKK